MSWLQIKTLVPPSQAAQVEDWLMQAGACAITLTDAKDEPVFEPIRGTTPLWSSTQILGLYDGKLEASRLIQQLENQWHNTFPTLPPPQIQFEILEDKDWIREWMDSFQPLPMGQRLWVVPSWQTPPDPQAVNLLLDPGLAFGTGTHPTTALCLQWLDAQSLEGKQLLDYGCGSGILAIAGLLLGAEKAWGVDLDPQALQASHNNARLNQINVERFPVCYPEQCPAMSCDILVANILAGPLIDLAPSLALKLKPGGQLALSGILEHQAQAVMEAYQPWFELDDVAQQQEWVRISGRRNHTEV